MFCCRCSLLGPIIELALGAVEVTGTSVSPEMKRFHESAKQAF